MEHNYRTRQILSDLQAHATHSSPIWLEPQLIGHSYTEVEALHQLWAAIQAVNFNSPLV